MRGSNEREGKINVKNDILTPTQTVIKLLSISMDLKFYPEAQKGAFAPKYLPPRQTELPPHLINCSLKLVVHFTMHSCASGNSWLRSATGIPLKRCIHS